MSHALGRRIHDLLLLLSYVRQHPGATVGQVCAALGIPEHKVATHVDRLVQCGRPPFQPDDLVEICLDGDRLYVDLDQSLGRPLRLTQAEAVALCLALRAVGGEGTTPWSETADRIEQRVREALGEELAGRVDDQLRRFAVDGKDEGAREPLAVLRDAVRERRTARVTYFSASRSEVSERTLHPYLLLQHLGIWYVVAHDERSGEQRIFRVDRIGSAALGDARFDVPADFDAGRFREHGPWITDADERFARVRFHPPVAQGIAEDWAPGCVERRADGTVDARLGFVDLDGFAAWLLGFGEAAEVLEPPELRAAVVRCCRAALACGTPSHDPQ